MKKKAVYTTGEVAEICNLSQQTIIRCFDNGQLKGFRVPGSRFRRIPHEALLEFIDTNDIPAPEFSSQKIRVLVVDDDPEIIQLFIDALEENGRFEVQTAITGYDAGVQSLQFKPDIIILDYMLPDINGNTICKSIRKNPVLQHIRILIISGVANPSEVDTLLQSGADEFIKKPFKISDLIDKIFQLVG